MAGQLTIDTLKASSGVLATQNGMTGICKAWVNFNGVGGAAIRNSFNVSSVTRNTTGDYSINLTTAMANANYAPTGIVSNNSASESNLPYTVQMSYLQSSSVCRITTGTSSGKVDCAFIAVAIFGN